MHQTLQILCVCFFFFFLALDGFTDETLVCDVVCPTLFHCCWESLGDRHNAGQFFLCKWSEWWCTEKSPCYRWFIESGRRMKQFFYMNVGYILHVRWEWDSTLSSSTNITQYSLVSYSILHYYTRTVHFIKNTCIAQVHIHASFQLANHVPAVRCIQW